MKKNIVYSFVALAGFPAVANAIEVNTGATKDASWSSAIATSTPGTYSVQAGATVSQKVTLQPGKYVVKGTYSTNVTITATGSAVKNAKQDGTKLTFETTAKGEVTITFKAKDGTTFTFSGVEVDLDYNFDTARGVLDGKLSSVKTALEGYEIDLDGATTRLDANNTQAGAIQKEINEIGTTQTYNIYEKYELYKGNDANKIAVEIEALSKKAASDYAVDQMEGGDPGINSVEANFNTIDPNDPNKKILEPTLTNLKAKVADFDKNQTGTQAAVEDIQKQLKDLDAKIAATKTSYVSYKANLDKINAAQKEIDDAALAFNNNFTDKSFTDHVANPLPKGADIAYGKIYANLDAAAREELSVVAAKVKAARDANAAGHAKFDKGKYNAPADVDVKGEFKTGELIVKKSASDVQTEFLDKKTTLENQYKIASDFTNRVNKTPAKGAETLLADKKAAAETAITNFVAQLDGDNNAELAILTKNYPAGYIVDKNKKDAYSKAKDAVDEFEKAFGPADDYFTVVNNVAAAQDKLSKINLAKYDGDGYTPSTSYATYTAAISAELAPLAANAKKAYENGKLTNEEKKAEYKKAQDVVDAQNANIDALVEGAKKANTNYSAGVKNDKGQVVTPSTVMNVASANEYLAKALNGYSKKEADHGKDPLDNLLKSTLKNGTYTYEGINKTDADVMPFFANDIKTIQDAIGKPAADLEAANKKVGEDYGKAKTFDAKKTSTSTHYTTVQGLSLDLAAVKAQVEQLVKDANDKNATYGFEAPYDLRVDLQIQAVDALNELEALQTEVQELIDLGADGLGTAFGGDKGLSKQMTDANTKIAAVKKSVTEIADGTQFDPATAAQTGNAEKKAAVENNKKANAALAQDIKDIASYVTTLNGIKTKAEAAKQLVDANNASNTRYQTERDKVFGAGKTYEQIQTTVNTKYPFATAPVAVDGKTDTRYTDAVKKINDDLTKLNKAVADARKAEKLTDATWESGLKAVVDQVNALEATAKAVAENHQAGEDMREAANKVTAAIAALPAYDNPNEFYSKLLKGYTTNLATLNTSITSYEVNKKAVENKEKTLKALDELLTNVNAIPTKAAANLKAYNLQKKGVDGKDKNESNMVAVQNLYNKVYSEINATDQSSQLAVYNERLSAIQNKITAEGEKIEKLYNTGAADAKHTEVVKEIADLMSEINGISAEQSDNYNQAIADDNADRYNKFNEALKRTEAEFTLAAEAVDAFTNVTNPDLKDAFDSDNGATTEKIYGYPTKIKDLASKAASDYAKTKSPALYDPTGANTTTAENYGKEIKKARTDFAANILAAIAEDRYDERRNNGYNEVYDILEYTPEVKDKTKPRAELVGGKFTDIDDAIKAFKKARKDMNVTALDAQMNLLDDGGIEEMIATAQHEAAAADLQTGVDACREMVEPHLSYLATLTGQDEVIKGYKKAVKDYLEKGEKALATDGAKGACYTTYYAAEHTWYWLEQFDDDPYVTTTRSMFENASNIDKAQEELEAAAAEISAYHLDANDAAWFANQLTGVKLLLDNVKSTGGKAGATIEARNTIKNLRAAAKQDALDYLEQDVKTALQSQYNMLVSEKYGDLAEDQLPDDVKELKERINAPYHNDADDKKDGEVQKLRNQFNKDASKLEPAAIVAADKNLSETYDALQKARGIDEAANAAALATLNDGVKALEDKLAKFDEYGDEVKTRLADLKASVDQRIAFVKSDIEAHKDKADFYAEDILASITSLEAPIDNVLEWADNVQARIDANNAAYEDIKAKVDELQAELDKAYEEVSGYEANTERWTEEFDDDEDGETDRYQTYAFRNKQTKANIQKDIDALNKVLEADKKNIDLDEDSYKDEYAWDVEDIAGSIEWWVVTCAKQEASFQAEILEENMWKARYAANSKSTLTEAVKEQISQKLADIQTTIGTWDSFEEETDEGTVIFEDWTEGSLRRFIDDSWWIVDNPKTGAGHYGSYENLPEIMKQVEAIQAEIDKVNALIGDDSKLGDINGDGKVTVNDYVALIDHVLNGDLEEGSEEFIACDLNRDGKVNVADATCVINIILHGNIWAAAPARLDFDGGQNDVNVTTESLGNGVTRLAINLANTKSYVAAQMDIALPAGVNIVNESLGDRAANHTLTSKDVNGVHRILLSTITNDKFEGNDGAVLYIDVEATAAFVNGGIALDNVIFADANGRANVFSIANGQTTAINGIATEKSVSDKIYDFGGRMMNALKQGFNIVGGKKVYVK